ncbi:NACHT, LRR and PYD domains-containing protein 6-like isoform X2 [Dysidea avara]|uniref:NACHT, LRR and PYD domains-containing protein 6-like isoform X2 n=1 Tax=Dysidea avara TaxID=196820 RepID=UPI0033322D12
MQLLDKLYEETLQGSTSTGGGLKATRMMTELTQLEATLQIHVSAFENCADCTDILGHLQTMNIISEYQQEMIKGKQNRMDKNRGLILVVMETTRDHDRFKDLCYVLDENGQYKDFCDSLKTFYAILKCREEIIQLIEVDQILPLLEETDKQCLLAIDDTMSKKIFFVDRILLTTLPYFQLNIFLPHLEYYPKRYAELLQKINSTIQDLEEHHHKDLSLPESLTSFKHNLISSYKKLTCMGANDWHVNEANPQLDPINFHFNFVAINSDDDEFEAAQLRLAQHNILFKFDIPEEEDNGLTVISEGNILLPDTKQSKIMIRGAPGSGKSTFVIKVCKLWAENRLPQYNLVVRMRLNDPKIANAKSLSDLCSVYQEAEVTVIAGEMEKCAGRGILIILDGWDELDEVQQANSVFTDILSTRLPHATVMVTSRPSTSSVMLKEQYEFTHTFEMVRLTELQVQRHLCYCFGDNSEQKFMEEVNCLLNSKELLFTPLILSCLIYLYVKEDHKLPSTLTETFRKLLLLIVNRHLENPLQDLENLPDDFCCLLQLAYESILRNKSEHSEKDVSRICYHSAEVPSKFHWYGLVQKDHDPLTRAPKTYQFSSNIIQDFLSAYYLTKQFDPAQQKDEIKRISALSSSCEMLWLFYAGLTGFKDVDTCAAIPKLPIGRRISSMTGRFMYNLVAMIFMKNNGLKEYARRSYSAQEYGSLVYDQISKEHLLVLMACCAEAQNQEACRAFCNSNLFLTNSCYADIPDTAITGHFLSSLSYCIICSGKRWIIHCNSLPSNAIRYMISQMTEPREGDGSIYVLHTMVMPQQIDGLVSLLQSHLARHLQSLDLSHSTTFDPTCIEKLIPTLQSTQLVLLDLTNCNIEQESAKHLAALLHTNMTLEYLALMENQLSIVDVLLLTEALKDNHTLLVLAIDGALQQDRQLVDVLDEINVIRGENRAQPLGYDITETVRISGSVQRVFGLFSYNVM